MKLFETQSDITSLNHILSDESENYGGDKFINLVFGQLKNEKLSIICKYVEPSEYISYRNIIEDTAPLKDDNSNYYYGLSPKLPEDEIRKLVKGPTFANENNLLDYMAQKADFFMMDRVADSKEYLKALFARTLVRIQAHYGYIFNLSKLSNNEIDNLKKIYSDSIYLKFSNEVTDTSNNKSKNANSDIMIIRGRPSDDFLKSFPFEFLKENNVYYLAKPGENIKLTEAFNPLNNDCECKLIEGAEYYSGIIPRLQKINVIPNQVNPKVSTYELEISRTSFALEDSIDTGWINNHPLLKNFLSIIKAFDAQENALEKECIYQLHEKNLSIETINLYLSKSLNTEVIGISSNIVTSDGYLLFGLRSNKSVDANTLYPSVNGHSEINDSLVDFYQKSVYEDCPTIQIGSQQRIDFQKEIARETYSELSIVGFDRAYAIYGMSVFGIKQNNNATYNEDSKRRLHFNILSSHTCTETLYEVLNKWDSSTESFENDCVFGVKVNTYRSKWKKICINLMFLLKKILDYKGLITAISTVFAIFLVAFNLKDDNSYSYSDLISLIFAGCLLIYTIGDSFNSVNKYKKTFRKKMRLNVKVIESSKQYDELKKYHKKITGKIRRKKSKSSIFPIGMIMLDLYLLSRK